MDEVAQIMNKGLSLADNASKMMENHSEKFNECKGDDGFASFDIVDNYHVWLDEIRNFLSDKLGNNNVNLYHFSKETENIPTKEWLDRNHHFNGDYIPHSLLQDIFNEIKKKVSILKEIYEKNENIFDKMDKQLSFDEINRKLCFMGKEILISNKEEGDTYKLLKTIFKDKDKTWNNDEIIEDWGYDSIEEIAKNKIYQAGIKVNDIIAIETTIKDFLEVTTKSVKINREYL